MKNCSTCPYFEIWKKPEHKPGPEGRIADKGTLHCTRYGLTGDIRNFEKQKRNACREEEPCSNQE